MFAYAIRQPSAFLVPSKRSFQLVGRETFRKSLPSRLNPTGSSPYLLNPHCSRLPPAVPGASAFQLCPSLLSSPFLAVRSRQISRCSYQTPFWAKHPYASWKKGTRRPPLPSRPIIDPAAICALGSSGLDAQRIFYSSQNPPPRNRFAAGLGMLGTGGLVLLGKGKYLIGALKLTKFASLGSMLLTVGAYTAFYGFPYAVGMVSLILVHESGHALVMKRLGIPFSPMVFVPFMGAFVAMKGHPRDAYQEALVAFGGPALGSAGALGVAGAAHLMDSHLLFALADFGFMINLFNMLPLGMMDGGRICGAISPYAGLVGLGLGGTMAYQGVISNPIFYLVLLAGGYETFMRFYDPLGHAPANYYRITPAQRAAVTGGYFGLLGALIAAMAWNHQYMIPPEMLSTRRDVYFRTDM